MPSVGGITLGVVSGGIALVVLVLFGFETVWSVRQALRQPTATAEALRKHDRAAGSLGRAAAITGLIAAMAVLSLTGGPGYLQPALPLSIGGAIGLLVLIVVERRWPAPGGTIRAADVQPRRPTDVLPRAGTWIAGIAVLLAAASIVLCGALGTMIGPAGSVTASADWPDWRWSTAQLVGLAVVSGLIVVSVVQLLHRPALAGFDRSIDLAFRRSGVDRALRVVSVVGFCQVATVLNAINNAGLDADASAGLIKIVVWASIAAVAAALISIPAFRTHPPEHTGAADPVAVVTR